MFTNVIPGHWDTEDGTAMANRCLTEIRADLGKADLSDLALANAVFMAGRYDLDLIVYQTAAKERIRWLSAHLAAAHDTLRQIATMQDGEQAWWARDLANAALFASGTSASGQDPQGLEGEAPPARTPKLPHNPPPTPNIEGA